MADDKPKKAATPRGMRPSTLLTHVEDYCKDNELGQGDSIEMLINQLERDTIDEAKKRG